MTFFDSDVVIDIYRGYLRRSPGLASVMSEPVFVSGFVRFELVQGCRSGEELRRIKRVLRPFETVWPSAP